MTTGTPRPGRRALVVVAALAVVVAACSAVTATDDSTSSDTASSDTAAGSASAQQVSPEASGPALPSLPPSSEAGGAGDSATSAPVEAAPAPSAPAPSASVPPAPAPNPAPVGITVAPPDVAAEPAAGSFVVEVVRGLEIGPAGAVDVFRPVDGERWPTVVVFGDDDAEPAAYDGLATALAEEGAVVFVTDYERAEAPIASACAMASAVGWASAYGGAPELLSVIGVGFGANVAVGEALGGPWKTWAPNVRCAADVPTFEPLTMVAVAGEFDAFAPSAGESLASDGLSPYDQLGGNPYIDVRIVTGDGSDGERSFHDALVADGYDVTSATLTGTGDLIDDTAVSELVPILAGSLAFSSSAS